MSFPFRLLPRPWILVPLCAFGFVVWSDYVRMQRVEFVSQVAREDAVVDASSPTGYADGKRWLIVPEHNNPTCQWIEETQLMLSRGDWRVRRVDYENSPIGRDVHSASPYRWWLVGVAWMDHVATGHPMGLSLERAALFADPILHLLLLVCATIFVARRFGAFPAALLSVGLSAVYPLAAAFLPGVANDFGLVQICAFWSIILVLAGSVSDAQPRRCFLLAGVAGGCGLWLAATEMVPVIAGMAAGAALASIAARVSHRPGSPGGAPLLPWRTWGFGGAITSLLAYLIEYFPSHMEPQLRANYPLYGVAWLGLGELLWRFSSWMNTGKPFARRREIFAWLLAAAALASLPVAILLTKDLSFLANDLQSTRLSNLPDGVVSVSLSAWTARDGASGAVVATLVPLLLLIPAALLLFGKHTGAARRTSIGIALGAVLASIALAVNQLRWWNTLDVSLLALVVAASAAFDSARSRWLFSGLLGGALAFGFVQLLPAAAAGTSDFKFTRAEVEGLYERALAQWISDHAGPEGATVLVPPYRTPSFGYYGGLRGLGTPNWENREGLSATFRIVTSTRPDETLALLNERGVTYIVLPSWDTDLDELARMGLKQPMDSFIYALHQTDGAIFNWLKAIPYSQPEVSGFNEQSVLVLQVTDETDPATLRSRLVEYLVEMHRMDQAAYASKTLLRYPADLGALVALAQVAKAQGDEDGFAKDFKSLVSNLTSGSDRSLAWDRRVSLAVVLALGGRDDLSRAQVARCMHDIDNSRIRSLTTGSLYHLLVLLKNYGAGIRDPRLHSLALKLLPSELRERL